MSGRMLPVMLIDEFTAARLRDLIDIEISHLKAEQDTYRDACQPLDWARVKLSIQGLHRVWSYLNSGLSSLGEPTQEDTEEFLRTVNRVSSEMPRSKANEAAWRQAKAEQKAKREALRSAPVRRNW